MVFRVGPVVIPSDRTLRIFGSVSTLPPDARGLAELRLHSDLDGKNATCAAIPGRTRAERSVWDMRRRLAMHERVLTFSPSLLQAVFPER